eukprot:768455-Hanusia_phi.AAC.8
MKKQSERKTRGGGEARRGEGGEGSETGACDLLGDNRYSMSQTLQRLHHLRSLLTSCESDTRRPDKVALTSLSRDVSEASN